MFSSANKTIGVLDIGTSKIVSIIATSVGNKFEILGVGNHSSHGIRHGIVSDVKVARSAIASSIYEAEKMAGKTIDKVIVNVSNPLIKSRMITIRTDFSGNQILPSDLKKLKSIVFSKVDLNKDEILSYKVLGHDLDEMKGVLDPEFMFANLLVSYIHIVTIPVKYLVNIGSCLLGCQLKVNNFLVSSEASASVCLEDVELRDGCVLIDIGGGNADYIVYKNKRVLECGVIPLGGENITKDIAECFAISFEEAEKIKVSYGALMQSPAEIQDVEIKRISGQKKEINTQVLNKVIRARFSEILDFVMKKLKEKKQYKICLSKIIFTGGVSKTVGLKEFVEGRTKSSVRVGAPNGIIIDDKFTEDPVFSTSLGLLKNSELQREYEFSHETSKLKKAIVWLKQNF